MNKIQERSTKTTLDTLLQSLETRSEWDVNRLESLEDRKREEIDFHNFEREQDNDEIVAKQVEEKVHANKKWYRITKKSHAYVDTWIADNSKGKIVLDYACGIGENAIKAAEAGAEFVIGLDISDVSVKLCNENAQSANVTLNTRFVQGDCEATEFPDNAFDTIICCGMLHHLDLEIAFTELRRILKPGGKILCVEALANNPLIQWYRNTTPNMRTEWEAQHILKFSTLNFSKQWFTLGEVRFWHLASIPSALIPIAPIRNAVISAGDIIDSVLLRIPLVQRMAWQFTFELVGP